MERRPSHPIENYANLALWAFDGWLYRQCTRPPTVANRSKWWGNIVWITTATLAISGTVIFGIKSAPNISRPWAQTPIPQAGSFRPPSVWAGPEQTQVVESIMVKEGLVAAFGSGMIANYVPGLAIEVAPTILDELSRHPQVGINIESEPNRILTGLIFLLPESFVPEGNKQKAEQFMTAENAYRALSIRYLQRLRAMGKIRDDDSGRVFMKAISVHDAAQDIMERNPPNPNRTDTFYRMALGVELSLRWAEAMKEGVSEILDIPPTPLSPRARQILVPKLPIKIVSIDPSQWERKSLGY